MQIKFVLRRLPEVNSHTHPPYKMVTSGRALENYPAGYKKVSPELIFLARAIVLNQDFVQFIKNFRQKYGLPREGFEPGPCRSILKDKKHQKLSKLAQKVQWHLISGTIGGDYTIHPLLKPHLFSIVWCNTIETEPAPISIDYATEEEPWLELRITHNIKFSELISFLNSKKEDIEHNLQSLSSKEFTETNLENIRLLGLQTKNMTESMLFEKAKQDKVLRKSISELSLDTFHRRCGRARKLVKNLFITKRT